MRFVHTKCGGEIDVKKRQCMRCKKKWDPVSFRLDPTGIRPMVDGRGRLVPGGEDIEKLRKQFASGKRKGALPTGKSYASWLDKLPKWIDLGYARALASRLPRWPRWARVLATAVFIAAIVVLILYC